MLRDTLLGLLRLFGPVYIILDALDECPKISRNRVMSLIQDLLTDFGHICSILFTSRPAQGIESVIQTLSERKVFIIDLQDRSFVLRKDITRYVDKELCSASFVNKNWSSDRHDLIRDRLTKGGRHM